MAKRDLTKIEPDDATDPLPSKRRSMSDIKSMMGAAAMRGAPADRYESVRPYGFENSIQRAKDTLNSTRSLEVPRSYRIRGKPLRKQSRAEAVLTARHRT